MHPDAESRALLPFHFSTRLPFGWNSWIGMMVWGNDIEFSTYLIELIIMKLFIIIINGKYTYYPTKFKRVLRRHIITICCRIVGILLYGIIVILIGWDGFVVYIYVELFSILNNSL